MQSHETLKKSDIKQGAKILVHTCANLKENEKVLIVSDAITREVGEEIEEIAQAVGGQVNHLTIEPLKIHGQEPPTYVAEEMFKSDVIFGLTKMSMAHTLARQKASRNNARYLSLPDYSLDLLSSSSLQVDFKKMSSTVEQVTEILSKGEKMVARSEIGSEVKMNLKGRKGNSAPGWCSQPGTLASPPDIESNIAPLEEESEGILVVNGSIPCDEIGMLENNITVEIKRGKIIKINGKTSAVLNKLLDKLQDSKTRVLAEVGFGLNPKAKLKGVMLEDEGCAGTVHFGFGSNMVLGGINQVPFHLDMVVCDMTIYVDGQAILRKGEVVV